MTRLTEEQIKAAADRAEARSRKTTTKDFVDSLLSADEVEAEIKKLAALPISVYESLRAENADRLSMRASVLDTLVKAQRKKSAKAAKPEPTYDVNELRNTAGHIIDDPCILDSFADRFATSSPGKPLTANCFI
jgi:hypothetical protein